MKTFTVASNEAGQRFDKYLQKLLRQAPSSFIYKMLRKKNIVLNDRKATGREILALKDSVKLYLSDETFQKFCGNPAPLSEKAPVDLDVIYEDAHILLMNKPAGLLSQKASVQDDSMNDRLLQYLVNQGEVNEQSLRTFTPSICNRLDRNTSGIIVAGKSLAGLQKMSELLHNRTLHKYYICIVQGIVEERATVHGYLSKDERTNKVTIWPESKGTKKDTFPIWTQYVPLLKNQNYTLLCVKLITGKTHQIRAHLSAAGHGIAGDTKYGDTKCNRYFQSVYGLRHQLLHACMLVFPQMEGEFSYLSGRRFLAPPQGEAWNILQQEFAPLTDYHILEELLWQPGVAED